MKIAIAQIASKPGDIESNLESHLQTIERAVENDSDLVIFPELSLTGYNVRERAAELAISAQSSIFQPLLEASRTADVLLGFIEFGEDFRIFNSTLYLAGGSIRHQHRKTYLPTYGRFDEAKYFAAGDTVRAFDLWADESRLAKMSGLGRLRMGALICEELWHASVPWLLAQDGAQLMLVQAAASGLDSLPAWETLAASVAISYGAFILLANNASSEGDGDYFGRSFIIDPAGRRILHGSSSEPELLFGEVDFDQVRVARIAMPLLRDERLELTARELDRIARKRFGLN